MQKLLAKLEWYYFDLNVAIEGSDILDSELILEGLKQRLESVQLSKQKVRTIYAENKFNTLKADLIMDNIIAFRETEEKLLVKMIGKLTRNAERA